MARSTAAARDTVVVAFPVVFEHGVDIVDIVLDGDDAVIRFPEQLEPVDVFTLFEPLDQIVLGHSSSSFGNKTCLRMRRMNALRILMRLRCGKTSRLLMRRTISLRIVKL